MLVEEGSSQTFLVSGIALVVRTTSVMSRLGQRRPVSGDLWMNLPKVVSQTIQEALSSKAGVVVPRLDLLVISTSDEDRPLEKMPLEAI